MIYRGSISMSLVVRFVCIVALGGFGPLALACCCPKNSFK